jgi:hypothetical protein
MADGATLRDHLESRWRQSGKMPEELNVEELPDELEYVWNWFRALNAERQYTDMGSPKPLSSEQIKAWQGLEDVRLSAFELKAIRMLDGTFMNSQQKKGGPKDGDD